MNKILKIVGWNYFQYKSKDTKIIVMTSIYMLPNNSVDLKKFFNLLKKNKNEFFFIFENILCKNLSDLKKSIDKFNTYKKLNKLVR